MSDPEARAVAFLESSIEKYRIFIDTSSLLCEYAEKFWSCILPLLWSKGKSIIVPFRVYEEVKKFADDPALCAEKNSPDLNRRAKNALKNIVALQKEGIIEVYGDKSDNFADNVFQTVFTQFRLKYDLMLITQDHDLASDISTIGKSKAVNTKNRICVEKINQYGYLSVHHFDKPQPFPERRPASSQGPKERTQIPDDECFAFATCVREVTGKMSVSSVPGKESVLIAEREGVRKPVKLIDELSSGGEGTIYTTDLQGFVAKIYKSEKLDRARFEKLSLMMTKSINCEGVCFPLALLYNQQNEFVGYLMKRASGKELQHCVFMPRLLTKYFPDWTKVDTVTLCVTILKKLKYLHDRNIILGDINPNNILVVSPAEVYFVDTDSYQVEGFPCPVGTINYTAPEIQRKEYSSFLRTLGNERFAVATLLFMIMLPGKPPYSLRGGENQIDNIINGDFAYPSGGRSTGKAPEGMWRFCWSHLPRYLKDDFYETFRKGGEHSTEKTRFSTGDWLGKFENYLELLTSGKMAEQDEMSMSIFPSRLKKNSKYTYVRCRICGDEVEEDRTEQGICQKCLKDGDYYRCARCGCQMVYTNYQKHIKKSPRYKICKDCSNEKKMLYTVVRCAECGRTFEITNGEKEFYEKKGFQLPKKCQSCRGQRSYGRPAYYGEFPEDREEETLKRLFSGCFITTAACEHFGKPDDCYELTTLRQFRDGWLALQPGGEETIREYYRIAPVIVKALNASSQRDTVYSDIWNHCILPCVQMIEQGAYGPCRALYEKMVLGLKQKYYNVNVRRIEE